MRGLEARLAGAILTGAAAVSNLDFSSWTYNFSDHTQIVETETNETEKNERKTALALIASITTDSDPEFAFKDMEETLPEDFGDIQNYDLRIRRTSTIKQIREDIIFYGRDNPIDSLVLVFHGNRDGILINSLERITVENVREKLGDLTEYIDSGAVIILYCCSTGKGEDSFAEALSNATGRDVMAPTEDFMFESSLKYKIVEKKEGILKVPINEIVPDRMGRPVFYQENFRIYKIFEVNTDPHEGEVYTNAGKMVAKDTFENESFIIDDRTYVFFPDLYRGAAGIAHFEYSSEDETLRTETEEANR